MIRKINSMYIPEELKQLRTKGYSIIGIADELKQLINDMAETVMAEENCVGLSANQVWDDPILPPPAIFLVKMKDGCLPFLNPILVKEFKKETETWEQCMSVPGKKVKVRRPYHIATSFMDGEGTIHNQHFYDMMARIWMHEYDHIQGKLITDYE